MQQCSAVLPVGMIRTMEDLVIYAASLCAARKETCRFDEGSRNLWW